MSILSWRIQWLTWISRTAPSTPASEILNTAEISILQNHFHKNSETNTVQLTVAQALKWIAQLGGFLNRKSDGDPGPIVIWRGWSRLSDMTVGWELHYSNNSHG
jgi:hypothetical protein